MELNKLFRFLEFFKKSTMIMSKNGKLMVIVPTTYVIMASLFFVLNISRIKPLIFDFVTKSMMLSSQDPRGHVQLFYTIHKDIQTILGTELVFILALFMTSLIAQNAIILLIGASYKEEKLSHKDLFLRVSQSFTRIFITSFHVTLLRVGFLYTSFFSVMVLTVVVSGYRIVSRMIFWVLVILVASLYLYLSIVWVLSLVVSVLEECSGIEALARAGRLIKGNKLQGFLLNLLLNLLSYGFTHWLRKMIMVTQSELTHALILFFLMGFICSVVMLEFQAYTVLYFECKKSHGEEIELQGSVGYSKITRMPLVDEELP